MVVTLTSDKAKQLYEISVSEHLWIDYLAEERQYGNRVSEVEPFRCRFRNVTRVVLVQLWSTVEFLIHFCCFAERFLPQVDYILKRNLVDLGVTFLKVNKLFKNEWAIYTK